MAALSSFGGRVAGGWWHDDERPGRTTTTGARRESERRVRGWPDAARGALRRTGAASLHSPSRFRQLAGSQPRPGGVPAG